MARAGERKTRNLLLQRVPETALWELWGADQLDPVDEILRQLGELRLEIGPPAEAPAGA